MSWWWKNIPDREKKNNCPSSEARIDSKLIGKVWPTGSRCTMTGRSNLYPGSRRPRKECEWRPAVSWFSSVTHSFQLLPASLSCVVLSDRVWRDLGQKQKDPPLRPQPNLLASCIKNASFCLLCLLKNLGASSTCILERKLNKPLTKLNWTKQERKLNCWDQSTARSSSV